MRIERHRYDPQSRLFEIRQAPRLTHQGAMAEVHAVVVAWRNDSRR